MRPAQCQPLTCLCCPCWTPEELQLLTALACNLACDAWLLQPARKFQWDSSQRHDQHVGGSLPQGTDTVGARKKPK